MADPRRIQLSRKPGWRMPEGTIKIDRTTRWGNPFTIEGAIEAGYAANEAEARIVAVDAHRSWLLGLEGGEPDVLHTSLSGREFDRLWQREHLPDLIGKTLGCWCGEDEPCHGNTYAAIVRGEDEAGRVLMGLLHPYRLPAGW